MSPRGRGAAVPFDRPPRHGLTAEENTILDGLLNRLEAVWSAAAWMIRGG